MNEIDAAVPGIERLGLGRFQRCRSTGSAADARTPGCVAIVDVEFDGPDADRQRAWSDTVFEAMEGDPAPHPGLIPAHFHVSADGTRVLDYAEWESAGAHADAVGDEGDSSALPPR
ncbi:hypothetical protein GCM10012287_15810 [Streptomyces daqingensis]|uniref:Antibiotic biosynthesis monooxygenase n=1 Tax=Streptomyces daqingensis TaxID=1472640 RepID=A0ABQ2M5F7_9ACTN|nr:antibiotic biosynthesis monooxygenase [Streptomyces daqingensis]GGO46158.1 hypothetical protein GCM10012287_15810 [Streptomyces daqingensis]